MMNTDISTFDIASFEIFKDIIQNGPITAYSIKTERKWLMLQYTNISKIWKREN